MNAEEIAPVVTFDDFARRFAARNKKLMWLLGAGASASAGLPTAYDMILQFKQMLFVSQRGVALRDVEDLANPVIQGRLQSHIDALGNLPEAGDPDEYASLFERVYPSERDRQSFIRDKLLAAKPSYGHMALAELLRQKYARIVWTTNFDTLIADACAKVYGETGSLTTADLNSSTLALEAIQREQWPVEVKMHGDFRSQRLKNTSSELQSQDVEMRSALENSCQNNGLLVAGYSGRDESLMSTLRTAIDYPNSLPDGFFWLLRADTEPLPRVTQLINFAIEKGVEAAFVYIESFDELMRDLIRVNGDLDFTLLDEFAHDRDVLSPAPSLSGRKGTPVLRLNALPIVQSPTECKRVICKIGGTREVRAAVAEAKVDVIAARSRGGVLAFGSDDDLRTAFGSYEIQATEVYNLTQQWQMRASTERGLLRDVLTDALARHRNMVAIQRGHRHFLVPRIPTDGEWSELARLVGPLEGTVNRQNGSKWREGVGVRLDWANDRLWLVFEPRIVFAAINRSNRSVTADFARERTVRRYNRDLDKLLGFWSRCLSSNGEKFTALGDDEGIDAKFQLGSKTAGSKRFGA